MPNSMERVELVVENGVGTVWKRPNAPGVLELRLGKEGGFNRINPVMLAGFTELLDEVGKHAGLAGLVLTSAARDFCVGADLDFVASERDPAKILAASRAMHGLLRRVETLGVGVVVVLDGSALGGGYEIALAAHHRVAVAGEKGRIGLPEVNLGVIPGGGGTQRLPRIIGIQGALEVIVQGLTLRAEKALEKGLVDAVASNRAEAFAHALAWLEENPPGSPGTRQPWDRGVAMPEPAVDSPDGRNLIMAAFAMLTGKTHGAYAAPEAALAVVQEGCRLSFDRGLEVEARAFARLVVSPQAKAMIRTLWYSKTAAEKHQGLPALPPGTDMGIRRVGVLGAGMMGAGIAFISAKAGFSVVLKDIDAGALERGLAHVREEAAKLRGLSAEEKATLVGRVQGSLRDEDLDGMDLIIEAVAESVKVKHAVLSALEPRMSPDGIWASNTSALPITSLAQPSARPEQVVGLHFFSPVEKMPLLEVIAAAHTDLRTLVRSLAFCKAIGKTPILVNDGYGFFTTRVFAAYILEGVQLVAEGVDPRVVEQSARAVGMVVPPLQVFDEVSLSLGRHVLDEAESRTGLVLPEAKALLLAMVDERGRAGRLQGAGFYAYADGKRRGIWPELGALARGLLGDRPALTLRPEEVGARLLFAQAVEAARAVDDGVVRRPQDADVGAILGIGFAPNTGGPLVHLDQMGLAIAEQRLDALAQRFGPRFAPPSGLRRLAAAGEGYYPPGAV